MPRYRTLLLWAAASPALAADLPPDLALVPGDAAAFVHVRAADLWRSPAFAHVRAPIEAAGPRLVAAYDKRFTPAPSTLERVTAILPAGGRVAPVVVLHVAKPFDRARHARELQPLEAQFGYRVEIVDDRTFRLGPPESLQALATAGKGPGPLSPLVAAAATRTLTVAVNGAALPPNAAEGLPPPLQPLMKLKALTLTADFTAQISGELRLNYADAKAAGEALAAAQLAIGQGRRALVQARTEIGRPL